MNTVSVVENQAWFVGKFLIFHLLQAKRISIRKDMGLSEMRASAQLAREMTPKGY
jgi:hypothetical protein